ncbi:MAG: OmpA family protein [Saprospiraceae bacterium]
MKYICYAISIISCLTASSSTAQSLILNGGFESHGKIDCTLCYHTDGKYPSVVYHWDNGGWHCLLCDKDYRQNSDNISYMACPMDRISPQFGKAMISMVYAPGTNGIFGGVEGASHLSARTTEPMLVGRLYEVSLWLYVQSAKRHDPDWGSHLGIALLPQKLSFFNGRKSLIIPFIGVDTLVYDQWYQVKWRVRPLCTSNYMMIGVFADTQWPKSRSYADVRYFLDNVSVVEMPEASAVSDSSVYYCSRYDPVTLGAVPLMDSQTLWYENDAFELTNEHKVVLDTLARFAIKYPDLVFKISGHTDSTGFDNLALSQNRVQSVLNYLTKNWQLPEFRFIPISQGSKDPIGNNNTANGRAMNRRVEIKQSSVDLSAMFYRNALISVEDKRFADAFLYLNKWMIKSKQGSWIVLLFEPRFEILKKDKRWGLIEKKIRDGYRSFKYPQYAFLFDSLRMDDRKVLGELSQILNDLTGPIPELGSFPYVLPIMPQEVVEQKLREHFLALRPIIEKTGWPKKAEFGESATTSAFFLLQHSLDSAAYVRWLPVLKQTCEEGEAPWMSYAMLYDRCRIIAGKPQRYATHSETLENGDIRVLPWEGDEDTINDHRAKIGLSLLPVVVANAMKKE